MQIRDRIKELKRIPASVLRANPKNWRLHPKYQREALEGVLSEVGFASAVLARELPDGELELIDGHLRAEVSGDELVPVLVLDVNEAEAAKILATHDPLAAMALTDTALLGDLLKEIETAEGAVARMLDDLARNATYEHPGAGGRAEAEDPPCEYPLAPVLNEKYEYAVIFCRNETEWAQLQTKLGLRRERDYKSSQITTGRVVPFGRFMDLWNQRDMTADSEPMTARSDQVTAPNEDRNSEPQASEVDDSTQGGEGRPGVCPGKPGRRVSKRKARDRDPAAS